MIDLYQAAIILIAFALAVAIFWAGARIMAEGLNTIQFAGWSVDERFEIWKGFFLLWLGVVIGIGVALGVLYYGYQFAMMI